jgi:Zn-dependent protease/CBS domain-containing protein
VLGGRSIQLARVFGIRIGADTSWFIFLFLLIWLQSNSYRDQFPGNDTKAFGLAVASAFLFVLSILLHELGHAAVAIRNGIGIAGIDLWMFGGLAKMRKEAESPGVDFRIAAGGPFVTLLIAGVCFAIGAASVGVDAFWRIVTLQDAGSMGTTLVGDTCFINGLLLAFNLLPGLPLDGGRILRSIVWWRTGDRNRATHAMAIAGRVVAYGVGAFSLLLFARGWTGLGIWLIFVALILSQGARSAEVQTAVVSRIEHLRVADVMDSEPVALPAEAKLDRALDDYFIRYGWDWFPVIDVRGRFLGLATREDLEKVPEALRPGSNVSEVTSADSASAFRIRVDEPLEALLGSEGLQRLGAIMAVDGDGVLRGVVTIEQVSRALQPATRLA